MPRDTIPHHGVEDREQLVDDSSSETGRVDAQGVKGSIAWSHSAFPDLRVTIEDQVAEGGKVATRWTVRGTHQGEMLGAAPTGNQVMCTGTQTDYIWGGKMVESRSNWDTLGMLQQFGAVPAPGRQSGSQPIRGTTAPYCLQDQENY